MIVYRMCKAAHADLAGARAAMGRTLELARATDGVCVASPSLAVLEVLMHLDLPAELILDDMVLLTIDVPDDAAFD